MANTASKENSSTGFTKLSKSSWSAAISKYQTSDTRISIRQVLNTFIPFVILWALMYFSLAYSYWITLALSIPAAGLLVRIFIIQHDCGHGSFFKSRKANDYLGSVCGIFTLTPYYYWRKSHAIHHASAGNLEQRGIGDIYTMTVSEYLQQSAWGKLKYRIYRHPLVLFGIGPIVLFFIMYRFPHPESKSWKRERNSVWGTNIALVTIAIIATLTIGLQAFLMVHLPIAILGGMAGAWLFFVQHQFEDTYWAGGSDWDYSLAALQGSSYYKLPWILQWFTGNIGFHHIHHLSPRIPNYSLQACHEENPIFQQVVVLTLWSSFRSVFLSLWDEEQGRLVSFSHLNRLKQAS